MKMTTRKMNEMVQKLKKLCKIIRGFLPERLPIGMAEFEAFAKDMEETYNLPTKDPDSIRFTLSTIIMHQGQTTAYRAKFYFYLVICASAAKQIAGANFQAIKDRQKKRAEEAELKAKQEIALEATSAQSMVANESQLP
jgi:hypothetical protein